LLGLSLIDFHPSGTSLTAESMDKQKQNALIAFLCFNLTVIVYQLFFSGTRGEITFGSIGGGLISALFIGVVVGAIVWGICAVLNR
jgi:hypothetical protein